MACLPDPGRFRVLRRYERWRKGDNLSMMMTFDALKRLFGSRAGPLGWLRNTGLMLTDRAPVVKHMLIRHSLGVHLDAARLSRGESLGYPNVPL
jgi:2-octaprenylphenol hydroxylase